MMVRARQIDEKEYNWKVKKKQSLPDGRNLLGDLVHDWSQKIVDSALAAGLWLAVRQRF